MKKSAQKKDSDDFNVGQKFPVIERGLVEALQLIYVFLALLELNELVTG